MNIWKNKPQNLISSPLRSASMPCPPELLKRVDEAVDNWLKRDSKDEPPRDPLDAPKQFLSDSPPEMPKENLWDGKPPVPIEHL
jgi:hypothetical protein